jgi:hypothetical protein
MTIFASSLSEFDTAAEAHQAFRQDLLSRVARTDALDYMAQKITLDMTTILDRHQSQIEATARAIPPGWPIQPLDGPHHFVIADTFGGNVMVRRYSDGGLVVIDRNWFLLVVSYIFFQSRPKPYGSKLAAWMLFHFTILPGEPFPLLDAFYLFAARLNRTLINDLCRIVGFFLLAHELGHRYVLEHGTGYVRAQVFEPQDFERNKARIRDFRPHENGSICNILLDGQEPPILLFQTAQKKWMEELCADLYACYLHMARYRRAETGLETLVNQFSVWQQMLLLMELRQHYQDRSDPLLKSHPPSTLRMGSLVHHFEKLSLEFSPDFRSSSLTILKKQYTKTWSSSFFGAWADLCTFAFYTVDTRALPEDIIRNEKGDDKRTYSPGIFRRFLEDFAASAIRMITKSPDHDVEVAWGRQLSAFNRTYTMNSEFVFDQLADEIRAIGLEFEESE